MELTTGQDGFTRGRAHELLDTVLDAGFDASLEAKGDDYTIKVEARYLGAVRVKELCDLVIAQDGLGLEINSFGYMEIG